MKSAVVFNKGELPKYVEDFTEPTIQNDNQLLMSVKAVAIKHLDKMRASGKHYSTQNEPWQAKVVGGDGVGLLADGTRVFAFGVTGTIAEKAVIDKNTVVKLPEGIDNATACALPNAVMGSALALRFRAEMKAGETILINGATGFTGKTAVQIAKLFGVKKVIATGRNEQALESLKALGADEIISLNQNDEAFISQLKNIHNNTPIDVVLDYLWGHPAEMILDTLKGNGGFSHKTRFVTIGGMAGDKIQLSSSILRSTDIQISGSGFGSWSREEMNLLFSEILPEMFKLASEEKIKIETESIPLIDIEKAWEIEMSGGKRLVVIV